MTETRLVEDPVKAWPEISKYCFLQKFSESIVLDEVPFLLHKSREPFKTCRCVSEEEQARLPSLQAATPAESTATLGPERPKTHATTLRQPMLFPSTLQWHRLLTYVAKSAIAPVQTCPETACSELISARVVEPPRLTFVAGL